MKHFRITIAELKSLTTAIIKGRRVYGTTLRNSVPVFDEINDFKELSFTTTPTHLSAKKYLFPEREDLLRFDLEKGVAEDSPLKTKKQAIIGLHPCDIQAIKMMDKVFASGTRDERYLERRKKTLIIGTGCVPDEYCFCESLGNMQADSGFDIFLSRIKGGYLATTATRMGLSLIRRHTKAREATKDTIEKNRKAEEKKADKFKARLLASAKELPAIYEGSDEHPVWDRIGKLCYGCGSCNHVCPTCYCFDMKDDISLDLKQVVRSRVWDGCTLEEFAEVAGGGSFRKERSARLRHRMNRKFRYLTDHFNGLFCVGCGRCSRTCLVKINITEVTNELSKK